MCDKKYSYAKVHPTRNGYVIALEDSGRFSDMVYVAHTLEEVTKILGDVLVIPAA
jgi:hypothetical protein